MDENRSKLAGEAPGPLRFLRRNPCLVLPPISLWDGRKSKILTQKRGVGYGSEEGEIGPRAGCFFARFQKTQGRLKKNQADFWQKTQGYGGN